MRKKHQILCVLLSIFCAFLPPCAVSADFSPSLSSSAALLGCLENDQILYETNSNRKICSSGFMRFLAAIVIAEHTSPLEQVTIREEALRLNDSAPRMYLKEGETISVQDCLAAVLLSDADDALQSLALYIAPSFQDFIKLLNQKALTLGALHTHVSSLSDSSPSCSTTLYDFLLIAKAFWQIPSLRSILQTAQYEISPTNQTPESRFYNRTHPLTLPENPSYMPSCLGGYTSFFLNQDTFLLSYDKQEDLTLIAITINPHTVSESAQDHHSLLQYAHQNFSPVLYPIKGILIGKIPVFQNSSKLGYADIISEKDLLYVSLDSSSHELEMRLFFPDSISFPFIPQKAIGYIQYFQKQELIATIPCRALGSPLLSQLALRHLSLPFLQITSMATITPVVSHTHLFDISLFVISLILLVSYFFRRKPILF